MKKHEFCHAEIRSDLADLGLVLKFVKYSCTICLPGKGYFCFSELTGEGEMREVVVFYGLFNKQAKFNEIDDIRKLKGRHLTIAKVTQQG